MIDKDLDLSYIRKFKTGDSKSFDILHTKYMDEIYNFFYKKIDDHNETDVQDLTQNVFFRCLENLKNFKENATFRTWLFGIAKNVLKEYYREKYPKIKLKGTGESLKIEKISIDEPKPIGDEEEIPFQLESITLNPEEEVIKNEDKKELFEAIESLSAEQREIIILRFGLGNNTKALSIKETADYMKKSEGAVKMAFKRATESLRTISALKKASSNLKLKREVLL